MCHADENCGSYRNEGLDFSQRNLKRLRFLTNPLQTFNGRGFASGQKTRWQKGDVRGQMRQFGMEFPPERFNKLPNWIPDVSYQGITLFLRHEEKL